MLTVDFLYALQVVQRKFEVVCIHVLIERSHDGTGIVRVLQTQRMTQLMDRHQEQIITWRERIQQRSEERERERRQT